MKYRILVLAILSLAPSVRAFAQGASPLKDLHAGQSLSPTEARPLTLDDAIADALQNNPTLVALRHELDVVRQRPAQDRALAPPTLEAAIWQWPLDTLNPLNTNMYMFTARQDIPGRGKRTLRAAVAEKDIERASNDVAVRARDVVSQIKRAYLRLYVARQAVAIHEAGVDLSRQIAELTTAKYVVGHSGQQETLAAVVDISKLHANLIGLNEEAQLASAELNTLLNRNPAAPVGELALQRNATPLPAVDELQRRALMTNAELHAAHLDVERAEAELLVATGDYRPDFMIGGGYQLMPRSVGAWTASIGVTWPGAPWSRGGLDARKAEAAAEVVAARAREQQVVNAVLLSVQQAYVRAVSAAARSSLLDTTIIPQSQQVLDVSRIAYQANREDIAGLVQQQHGLLEARLEHVRALAAADEARADLELAVGAEVAP